MKKEKAPKGPCYKKELSIYKKETLASLETFRQARSHWLATADDSQKTFNNDEGNVQTNIYNGRCLCLRKIRLKTTLLRLHYQTLRPLRFWTLKRKLPEFYDLPDEMTEDGVKLQPGTSKKEQKPEFLKMTCSSGEIWTRQGIEECLQDAAKVRGKRSEKRIKECKAKKPGGPCREAIKRLKAAKIKEGMIESCKCEDGREVTVVIKGICLCDKTSLNKLSLERVCDEYKIGQPKPPIKPETPKEPPINPEVASKPPDQTDTKESQENEQISDEESVDSHHSDQAKDQKEVDPTPKAEPQEKKEGAIEPTKERHPRKLTYENEANLKGDGEGKRKFETGSELTVFRRLSSDFFSLDELFDGKHSDRNKKPVKEESALSTFEPQNLPQTESLNNLLVGKKVQGKPKQGRKKHVTTRTASFDEQAMPDTQIKPLPQTESMNNLFVGSRTPPKSKKTVFTDEYVTEKPTEIHFEKSADSLAVYKKRLKEHASAITEDKEEKDDDSEKTEIKSKVKLVTTPEIIPAADLPEEKFTEEAKTQETTSGKSPSPESESEKPDLSMKTQTLTKPIYSKLKETESLDSPDESFVSKPKKSARKGSDTTAHKDSGKSPGKDSGDKKKEGDEDSKLNLEIINQENQQQTSSMLTLYKNKTPEQSDMGLTKEEYDRMKQEKENKEKGEKNSSPSLVKFKRSALK